MAGVHSEVPGNSQKNGCVDTMDTYSRARIDGKIKVSGKTSVQGIQVSIAWPEPGAIEDGYRYIGGYPGDPQNCEGVG